MSHKIIKVLLALVLIVPTLLHPLSVVAEPPVSDTIETQQRPRPDFDAEVHVEAHIEPVVNVHVEPWTSSARATQLFSLRQTRQSFDMGRAIEPHIDSWTDEQINTLWMLWDESDFAFWLVSDQLELPLAIIHYYWISNDTGIDVLEIMTGFRFDQFTHEDINAFEGINGIFFELQHAFMVTMDDIFNDLLAFDDAVALLWDNIDATWVLLPMISAIFENIDTSSPIEPDEPLYVWTDAQWEQFHALLDANDEAWTNVMSALLIAPLILNADATTLEAWFGDDAEAVVATLLEIFDKLWESDIAYDTYMYKVANGQVSFDAASAFLIADTALYWDIYAELQEIRQRLDFSIWTDDDYNEFAFLASEGVNAFFNVIDAVNFAESVLSMEPDVRESLFGFSADDILALEGIVVAFDQANQNFWTALDMGHSGMFAFEEVSTLMTESIATFLSITSDLQTLFGAEEWTNEAFDDFVAFFFDYEIEIFHLLHLVEFAELIIHYHYLGQLHDLDLVDIILFLTVTDEDIAALEAILPLAHQAHDDFWVLVGAILNALISPEQAIALTNFQMANVMDIMSQFLLIIDGHLPPNDDFETGCRLTQLLEEIALLALDEADFTAASWQLFMVAYDAAWEIMGVDDLIDLMARLAAYNNLRTAFEALEYEEPPVLVLDYAWQNGNVFVQGTEEALVLVIEAREVADFISLYVHDELLVQGIDFTVEDGSIVLTILPEYLDTLLIGRYEVEILLANNEVLETYLLVISDEPPYQPEDPDPDVPEDDEEATTPPPTTPETTRPNLPQTGTARTLNLIAATAAMLAGASILAYLKMTEIND